MSKKLVLTRLIFTLALVLAALETVAAQDESARYDPDPKHLWNRLNETLFIRTASDGKKYGLHELDILYWRTTKHLLVEPSHQQVLAVLDGFIETRGEKLIRDPLKRALLQRDLWQLFDWAAFPYRSADAALACHALQPRLVTLIRRLALTTNEIAALPDNYAIAEKKKLSDLPLGMSEINGHWVSLGIDGNSMTAPTHVESFNGRSIFRVMVRLPEGQEGAISYLDKLRSFAQTNRLRIYQTNRFSWTSTNAPKEVLELNPDIPQFPTNTQWALVRRMCVIDAEGRIQPTSITESIQVRRYKEFKRAFSDPLLQQSTNVVQEFFEFQMDRRQNGALRTIGKEEKDFTNVHFMGKGIDLLEYVSRNTNEVHDSEKSRRVVLKTCFECHSSPGIFSVLSYTRFFSNDPANLTVLDLKQEFPETIHWKQRQFNWGLLQGIWHHRN